MEAIGAASAIIGVAQLGLQFSQVLITVIGDYRDAAKNINRLRDEIHLASISLQQLGDLASRDLLRRYGILEATNLRERTSAVFLEIRKTIQKGDGPLQLNEIKKEEIDVTRFMSFRWALWTKKQLEEPRQELDRLKSSMTLCFVSHMAILAGTDLERSRYASQIPGIKRSLVWSERGPDEDTLRRKLVAIGISRDKIDRIMEDEMINSHEQTIDPSDPILVPGATTSTDLSIERPDTILKAWSIDPLARTSEIPVSQEWLQRFIRQHDIGDSKILSIHAKLHPWFKDELNKILDEQSTGTVYAWTVVLIEPIFKNIVKRGIPKCVQVVLQGSLKTKAMSMPTQPPVATTYSADEPILVPSSEPLPSTDAQTANRAHMQPEYILLEPNLLIDEETDEEIIAKQLALYQ